jgi:hypothetical protein
MPAAIGTDICRIFLAIGPVVRSFMRSVPVDQPLCHNAEGYSDRLPVLRSP